MEGSDPWGLYEQAMFRASLAAGLRGPEAHGIISDALRFRAADENSEASAALLTAWATCRSTMEIVDAGGTVAAAPPGHTPAIRRGGVGSR